MTNPTDNPQEQDLENLIGDIKQSYQKSNLEDIDDEIFVQVEPEEKIGYFLKKIPNTSNREFSMNFDPVETVFMQKLVSSRTMDKRIVLRMEDYFKGIVFIDYFTRVITNDNGFTDELYDLAQELENINPLLDPDMGILTRYAGIYYVSNVKKKYFLKPQNIIENSKRQYREGNRNTRSHFTCLKKLDPFFQAVGKKVYDLIEDEDVKAEMKNFKGLNDLKALIFVDCILPYLEKARNKTEVLSKVKAGKYYEASMKAVSCISKEATSKSFKDYIKEINKKVALPEPAENTGPTLSRPDDAALGRNQR